MNENNNKQQICPICGQNSIQVCLECCSGSNAYSSTQNLIDTTSSAPGTCIISPNNLIIDADITAARLLGTERMALIGKPFTLSIVGENIIDFFVYRNAIFATHDEQKFEIKLYRQDRSIFSAQLHCTFVKGQDGITDCMQITFQDYSRQRKALNRLERQLNTENIIHALTASMIGCPAREIDACLTKELKTLAIFTGAERTYIGIVDSREDHFTITHEWYASNVPSVKNSTKTYKFNQMPQLMKAITKGKALVVNKKQVNSNTWDSKLDPIHMKGTKSFAYLPLKINRVRSGVIGYDALNEIEDWDETLSHLFKLSGQAFLQAIFRKQNEIAWLRQYKKSLLKANQLPNQTASRLTSTTPNRAAGMNNIPTKATKAIRWSYQKDLGNHLEGDILKVRSIDEKVLITCPICMGQDQVAANRFNLMGDIVLASCPCGFQFKVRPEKRFSFRKKVNLEGVYTKAISAHFLSDSVDFSGKIQITDLSKNGIGFITQSPDRLSKGNQIRIKFTLDDAAKSTIAKKVLIKGVNGKRVGGQFVGAEKDDIALGFYLM